MPIQIESDDTYSTFFLPHFSGVSIDDFINRFVNLSNQNTVMESVPTDFRADLRDYEMLLRGSESSGSQALEEPIEEYIQIIFEFARKIILNSKDVPQEFDKVLRDNFRDILA